MNERVLSIVFISLLAMLPSSARADFQFQLSLGPQQQTLPSEVFFDVSMTFTGNAGDYLDQFTLSVNNNSLPVDFDYTRISLRNLQNNFQGSGALSNVGIAAVTLSSPSILSTNNTLLLGELVFNTSGLQSGTYEIAFNATETDASGTIGGTVNEFLQDVGGLISSNIRSVSVVPEPTVWLGSVSLVACLIRTRRRSDHP